jgi:hypothetical protein
MRARFQLAYTLTAETAQASPQLTLDARRAPLRLKGSITRVNRQAHPWEIWYWAFWAAAMSRSSCPGPNGRATTTST